MPLPYTKQEILDIFKSISREGKISHESLANLVFDSRFPDDIFHNTAAVIQQASEDPKRIRVVAILLLEKNKEMFAIQEKVIEAVGRGDFVLAKSLKSKVAEIEHEVAPLDQEFLEIKKRLYQRESG